MKGDFQKTEDDCIGLTLLSGQSVRVERKHIVSFKANMENRTVLSLCLDEQGDSELVVQEDAQTVADLINGEPSDKMKSDFTSQIVRERQRKCDEDIDSLDRKYKREKEKRDQDWRQRRSDSQERQEAHQSKIRELNQKIQSTEKGRKAQQKFDELQREAKLKYRRADGIYRKPRLNLWPIAAIISVIEDKHKETQALAREKEHIREEFEKYKREKDQREYSYAQESKRLDLRKKDPQLSIFDCKRLDDKIREYKVGHEVVGFRFGRSEDGVYKKSERGSFKDRLREAGQGEKFERSNRRGRGRSRSRTREM